MAKSTPRPEVGGFKPIEVQRGDQTALPGFKPIEVTRRDLTATPVVADAKPAQPDPTPKSKTAQAAEKKEA